VIGPFYHKNKFMVETLEEAGGVKIAEAKEDIRIILDSLIKNADLRILMGAQAKNLTEKHKKITFNVAEKIKSELLNL
jgi:3-deoxy-D-manno-octulosonic-acid transferase